MSAFDVFQENKKSLNKHLVYSGTINLLYYRGSTLIACDKSSTHATFLMMITESPGLIRATPRWSSDEFLPKLFHQVSLSLGHFLSYSSLQRFTYSIRFYLLKYFLSTISFCHSTVCTYVRFRMGMDRYGQLFCL